jgi:hypothetical protein
MKTELLLSEERSWAEKLLLEVRCAKKWEVVPNRYKPDDLLVDIVHQSGDARNTRNHRLQPLTPAELLEFGHMCVRLAQHLIDDAIAIAAIQNEHKNK